MKRSTLTLITAGMLLAGTGAVELLGDASAGAAPVENAASTATSGMEVHSP
ncbi:hypothetical protein [Nocardia wallacei]|uniref:Uncharacterized protein n=1 Tax=Nocardia wallacei TaxID=480035 RepID=A0A7G1KGK8_9NOCA|nr:hypothetical protein [Nocardia wallacei]BCK54432.1 hypothetical protein NWFMUON74_22040 [Nocardia wallacei]